ncbi:hypothetical protein PoB_001721200 [Plakobranchus ocellatus]|uniref:Uncharacterized protein n=1 Tax=Plakobranchus ocellatus TaxID=259542 RepID=A0AAV3Z611_9GAST|nr:hypothetical protein PoB_001721200 [Plakobranchus ocellatus]
MAATMTETPMMTSSAAQTDGGSDDSEEDGGEVQVIELPSLFPPPTTATVGVQADLGARRLSQKTERVRREHQVSLKRLQRKFLSIRRKCQLEGLFQVHCRLGWF